MHETKYQPMEKADAEQIMEEILGMQCGLNPDQQVKVQTCWLNDKDKDENLMDLKKNVWGHSS